jgi:dihydropteroate synthase
MSLFIGADIINDVSGGDYDPLMYDIVQQLQVPYIIMHMRGTPETMLQPTHTTYKNILEEITQELYLKCQQLDDRKIPRWLQICDPGIGFAKQLQHNITILQPKQLQQLKQFLGNRSLLIGLSRKRFLSRMMMDIQLQSQQFVSQSEKVSTIPLKEVNEEFTIQERDLMTVGANCCALLGGADILRVHDVKSTRLACHIFSSLNIGE